MKTFEEFVNENKKIYIGDQDDLIKRILNDKKLKKIIGKSEIYFDGLDLAIDGKTVTVNPIMGDGTVYWDSIVADIKLFFK